MGFVTKIDYSDNRQIKQYKGSETELSGTTVFGIPFSGLTSGIDPNNMVSTGFYSNVVSTFSGNQVTTIIIFGQPEMVVASGSLSPITSLNSGTTQNAVGYEGKDTTIIDGNTVNLTYTGSTYDFTVTSIEEDNLTWTGTAISNTVTLWSGGTLDYTERTIWVDVQGITKTEKLILTDEPTINNAVQTLLARQADGELVSFEASGLTTTETDPIWMAEEANVPRLDGDNFFTASQGNVFEHDLAIKNGGGVFGAARLYFRRAIDNNANWYLMANDAGQFWIASNYGTELRLGSSEVRADTMSISDINNGDPKTFITREYLESIPTVSGGTETDPIWMAEEANVPRLDATNVFTNWNRFGDNINLYRYVSTEDFEEPYRISLNFWDTDTPPSNGGDINIGDASIYLQGGFGGSFHIYNNTSYATQISSVQGGIQLNTKLIGGAEGTGSVLTTNMDNTAISGSTGGALITKRYLEAYISGNTISGFTETDPIWMAEETNVPRLDATNVFTETQKIRGYNKGLTIRDDGDFIDIATISVSSPSPSQILEINGYDGIHFSLFGDGSVAHYSFNDYSGEALRYDSYSVAPLWSMPTTTITNLNNEIGSNSKAIPTVEWVVSKLQASGITFNPYITINSTNVQSAIEELKDELDNLVISGGTGATSLNGLSDVTASATTLGDILISNGSIYTNRQLVEADISDFGNYLTGYTNTDDYLTGGSFDSGTGDLDLNMQSGSTFTINLDGRYSTTDTNDYVTNAGFGTGDGVLTLIRLGGGNVTVNLDNRYALSGDLGAYLPLAGGTMSGNITMNNSTLIRSTAGANSIEIYDGANAHMIFTANHGTDNLKQFDFYTGPTNRFYIKTTGTFTVGASTATSFVKTGGTSSQFLKADGSVDTNAYLSLAGGTMSNTNVVTNLNADLLDGVNGAGYLLSTTDQFTSGTLTFNDSTKIGFGTSNAEGTLWSNGTNTYWDMGANKDLIIRDITTTRFTFDSGAGNLTATGAVTANTLVKIGGTNDDVLLGDGSTTSLSAIGGGGGGTVTSIGITAGALIDTSGTNPVTTSGNITVAVDLSELATSTQNGDGDYFAVIDTANVQRKLTKANIGVSGFNNDGAYVPIIGGTFTGDIAVGSIDLDGSEGIYFEDKKHAITWNDGTGNFNIRVGHIDNGGEVSTEAGYAFHTEYGQSTGSQVFNVSSASLSVGNTPSWRAQISILPTTVALAYAGSTKLITNTGGVTVTGRVTASYFTSTIGNGTQPFLVSSNTRVDNLNADLLDGQHGTYYSPTTHTHSNYLTNTTDQFTSGTLTFNDSTKIGFGTSGGESEIYSNGFETKWKIKNNNLQFTDNAGTTKHTFTQSGSYVMEGWFTTKEDATFEKKITATGNIISLGTMTAVAFYESSDKKLKENIEYLDDKFISFNLISDESKTKRYGVLAQDLLKETPELVKENDNGDLTVNYIDLLVLENVKLKNKIKELESKIELIFNKLM